MNRQKVRIDKWLWSVRIFKSRTIATEACKTGKVSNAEGKLKASYLVGVGEHITVHKNGFNLLLEVVELLEKRVSAPLAQQAYLDLTPEEELKKYDDWFIGKARPETREKGSGRPTKKERREIDQYKREDFRSP